MYEYAVELIRKGKAYVDDLTAEQIRQHRGTLTAGGKGKPVPQPLASRKTSISSIACAKANSPTAPKCCARRSTWHRPTSTCAIRSCTASCTRRTTTPATSGASTRCTTGRTASRTRSRNHPLDLHAGIREPSPAVRLVHRRRQRRPADDKKIWHPQQIEFARLNLTYTMLSKRKLLQLVTRENRQRLGRPAHADDQRLSPPRLHARGRSARSASTSA